MKKIRNITAVELSIERISHFVVLLNFTETFRQLKYHRINAVPAYSTR